MVAILAALDRASWLLLMGREGRAAPTHSRALPQLLRGLMSPPRTRRLLAFIPQEWFLKTHVIIESEASGVVSAIYDAGQAIAANDVDRLLAMLDWLEQARRNIPYCPSLPRAGGTRTPPISAIAPWASPRAGDGPPGGQLLVADVRAAGRRRLPLRARPLLPSFPPVHLVVGWCLRGAGRIIGGADAALAARDA
jgi:hypothetical protein